MENNDGSLSFTEWIALQDPAMQQTWERYSAAQEPAIRASYPQWPDPDWAAVADAKRQLAECERHMGPIIRAYFDYREWRPGVSVV